MFFQQALLRLLRRFPARATLHQPMKATVVLVCLLIAINSACAEVVTSFAPRHGKFKKRGEYLKHLLSAGQLYGGTTAVGTGLEYDKALLFNGNETSDDQMSHCEYFDLHPFITARPFRQCLRTNYYEFVSNLIATTGSYGKGVHEGCNFLFYVWSIFGGSAIHGLFVDAGANIGTCSLLFAANGINAVAFEPMPANYKIFVKSILGNYPALEGMIMLYPYGIGDKEGNFDAFMQKNNMGNSMMYKATPIHRNEQMVKERVNVKLMDDLLWANRLSGAPAPVIHLMKLDVQGFELKALQGARHLLAAGAISLIAFENERLMLQAQGTSCTEILTYLQGFNYTIYNIDGRAFPVATDCEKEVIGDLFAKLTIIS